MANGHEITIWIPEDDPHKAFALWEAYEELVKIRYRHALVTIRAAPDVDIKPTQVIPPEDAA